MSKNMAGACRKAILKDGQIVGWETIRPETYLTPEQWAKTPEGQEALKKLRAKLQEHNAEDWDTIYIPCRGKHGYFWRHWAE